MGIQVAFEVAREFAVRRAAAEVFDVLSNVPESARHFPKVTRLVDLGRNTWRWEMEKVGAASIYVQTIYAARYRSDRRKRRIVWTAVPGVGNAQVSGSWSISEHGAGSSLSLQIAGELRVPLPGLLQGIVGTMVRSENHRLIDRYVDNLTHHFGGRA